MTTVTPTTAQIAATIKAYKLRELSKNDDVLSEKLGLAKVTLYTRLKRQNWTKSEICLIETLPICSEIQDDGWAKGCDYPTEDGLYLCKHRNNELQDYSYSLVYYVAKPETWLYSGTVVAWRSFNKSNIIQNEEN